MVLDASSQRFLVAKTYTYALVGTVAIATGILAQIPSRNTINITGYAANHRLNQPPNANGITFELYLNSVDPSNLLVSQDSFKSSSELLNILLLPNDILYVNFYNGNAGEQANVTVYGYYL